MFKKKPHFYEMPGCSSQVVQYVEHKVQKDGTKSTNLRRDFARSCYKVLPAPNNYSLEALLRAGVPLKEIDCALLNKDALTVDEIGKITALLDKYDAEKVEQSKTK